MASNPYDVLKKMTIKDLRNFIKQNHWEIKGRSIDNIISKLKDKKINKNELLSQLASFHPKTVVSEVKPKKDNRMDAVEQQIQVLFQRINKLEMKINHLTQKSPKHPNKSIENYLLGKIPSGTGILVDELLKIPKINHFSLKDIEKTVLNLVDDGKIMVAEGSSQQKLGGYIGRLIKVRF